MIHSGDLVPHQAPWGEPASPYAYVSASLCVSHEKINKILKKKAGVKILNPEKLDFKPKTVMRDEGHYIIRKETIQQEDLTIVNIYTPNLEAPKYIKQLTINIKEFIDNNTIVVEDFNISFMSMDR